MAQKYKKMNSLKSLPFSSIVKKPKVLKNNKKISNISLLSELPFFPKKAKELSNKQLSDILPFLPKRKKDLKDQLNIKY